MIKLLNPESLERNPAFAQGTLATGSRAIHVGGQNGIDRAGAWRAALRHRPRRRCATCWPY
jgi:hypothetical protein